MLNWDTCWEGAADSYFAEGGEEGFFNPKSVDSPLIICLSLFTGTLTPLLFSIKQTGRDGSSIAFSFITVFFFLTSGSSSFEGFGIFNDGLGGTNILRLLTFSSFTGAYYSNSKRILSWSSFMVSF